MKKLSLLIFLLTANFLISHQANAQVRVAAYNVLYGLSGTPEQIGTMFKSYNLDMIGFNEVPDGDWIARVGKVLGMKYVYLGKISSANHKDKYKSILSRTPLTNENEVSLLGEHAWNPASAVYADTEIRGIKLRFYSLHVCQARNLKSHIDRLLENHLSKVRNKNIILTGDFNDKLESAALTRLQDAGFQACWKDLNMNLEKKFTWNPNNPKSGLKEGVIDHIFYKSKNAKATKAEIIELQPPLSDHKPVWAEINFKVSKK
jgi:maltose 6'-phosphate phosphatase